jgi:F420 biosynthesis protein FbiB-like protein
MTTLSDFLHLTRTRRSIRVYAPQPVPASLLQEILTAGIWAPSAHNRQPWRMAVILTPERKIELAEAMGQRLGQDLTRDGVSADIIAQDVARSFQRISQAPVLICLCLTMADMDTYPEAQRNQHEYTMAVQSVAMAGQNMLLAAHSAGLGACWLCAPLFCADVVRSVLALPDDWQPQGLLTLGYPAQTRERTRHPLDSKILWR